MPHSGQSSKKYPQAYSPTNRTAAIPMRKRKPREKIDQLIRVEDDLAGQTAEPLQVDKKKTRSNRFHSNAQQYKNDISDHANFSRDVNK